MPQLSIIVPVYNTAERLGISLDSLLAQDFGDFELILIDDGSTDRSPEICREYCAREPEKIRFFSGPNRGVGAARNRGLDAARGEWIAFCDSDDTVEPEIYRHLHDRAVAAQAELSCCALRRVSEDGHVEAAVTDFPCTEEVICGEEQVRERFLLPLLLSRPDCHGYLPVCLFRRGLIEAGHIRFTEGLNILEDVLFMLEYLLQVRCIAASEKPLYNYLRFERSLCARYFSARYVFEREKSWLLLEKRRLEIFLGSRLAGMYPRLAPEFRLRIFYHEAQAACCDPSGGGKARRRLLRDISRRARQEMGGAVPESASWRLFLFSLYHLRFLLPLLCFIKRKGGNA